MHCIVRRPQTADLFDKSLVFDLDDTLSFADITISDSKTRYASTTPNTPIVEKLRECHKNGWYITILTARHMRSQLNDVETCFNKLSQITADWLDRNDIPFDQLVFGKPYGMWYIDDKAMTLEGFQNEFTP